MASPHWFPADVRKHFPGWTVANARGRVQLRVRTPERSPQTVLLPYPWDDRSFSDAYRRVVEISRSFEACGCDLRKAATFAGARSSRSVIDWEALVRDFRASLPNVSAGTWNKKYQRVLTPALEALNGPGAPATGEELLRRVLEPWKPGTRRYTILRQGLTAFLSFGVARKVLTDTWAPPIAVPIANMPKRHGYPLSDAQILRVLDALPDTENGRRWRFAIQLLAVYGLRPQDLLHLRTRNGGHELWSLYRKSTGGRSGRRTEPRRLVPLDVLAEDGTPVSREWRLLERVHAGEELPPALRTHTEGAGQALGTYLRRLSAWQTIAAEAEREGQQLVPYSFRHRFSAEGHKRGVPVKALADVMGHTVETHLSSYARFASQDVEEIVRRANENAIALAARTLLNV